MTKQVQEQKGRIVTYLKMHPITAAYAKEPFLTYFVYIAVALALLLVWLTVKAVSGQHRLPMRLFPFSVSLPVVVLETWQLFRHKVLVCAGLFAGKKGRKVRKPPKRLSAASSSTTGSVQGVKTAKTSKKVRVSTYKLHVVQWFDLVCWISEMQAYSERTLGMYLQGRRITMGEDSIRVPE